MIYWDIKNVYLVSCSPGLPSSCSLFPSTLMPRLLGDTTRGVGDTEHSISSN